MIEIDPTWYLPADYQADVRTPLHGSFRQDSANEVGDYPQGFPQFQSTGEMDQALSLCAAA